MGLLNFIHALLTLETTQRSLCHWERTDLETLPDRLEL